MTITERKLEFRGVSQPAWEHYHAMRRRIDHDFIGRWQDADALLDDCVRASIEQERAELRAQMRTLSVTCPGTYYVPVHA